MRCECGFNNAKGATHCRDCERPLKKPDPPPRPSPPPEYKAPDWMTRKRTPQDRENSIRHISEIKTLLHGGRQPGEDDEK